MNGHAWHLKQIITTVIMILMVEDLKIQSYMQ